MSKSERKKYKKEKRKEEKIARQLEKE